MPSDRKIVAFRPDADEEKMLAALAKKHGLPMTRVLGQALRRWAEQERVIVSGTQHQEATEVTA